MVGNAHPTNKKYWNYKMGNNYQPLENEQNVIHILENDLPWFFNKDPMFKLGRLIGGIKCKLVDVSREDLNKEDRKQNHKKWIQDGIDVEILKVGSIAWQKGKLKVKVVVEFAPDEPESPLDDFRKQN
jgi:hypothetical protein